jgi:hypothetical protein
VGCWRKADEGVPAQDKSIGVAAITPHRFKAFSYGIWLGMMPADFDPLTALAWNWKVGA